MKLSYAVDMTVSESLYYYKDSMLLEDGEGPRWRFSYSNYNNDSNPDILLLGAYKHPTTNNNLVGGINLHYLSKNQIDQLARALPRIMAANNLYNRYHTGVRILPQIFNNFYRTYNAAYIHGITKDVMYPKYGFTKTAANWLKKQAASLYKPKQQRQQESEPKYPGDLEGMQNKLDQTVMQLQKQPPKEVSPDTPEMQAARRAFLQFRREQSAQQIDKREDIPLQRASQEYTKQLSQQVSPAERQKIDPTIKLPTQDPDLLISPEPDETTDYDAALTQAEPETPEEEMPDFEADTNVAEPIYDITKLEQERDRNQQELLDPNNQIDLEESIRYFSPFRGRYVVEPAYDIYRINSH